MGHDHHHDHTVSSLNKAFILGITLNVAFVVVEFAVGLYYGSMGLLSDAGHNLSDVASLLLAMLAFRLAQAHATPRYTYGYKKSTVLISLLNSVILLIAVGVIVAESIGRMMHPAPIEGGAIAWTAGVGVAMGNAKEHVREIADAVAPDNEHDGVAWTVERVLRGDFDGIG